MTTRHALPAPGPTTWSMRVIEQFSIVNASAASGSRRERVGECRADRAAMRDGDDVAAGMRLDQTVDRPRHPCHDIDEALAAGRRQMRRRMPEPRRSAAAQPIDLLVGHSLPIAEMLLGEIGQQGDTGSGDRRGSREPGGDDRRRGLVRAAQMARDPHRALRQLSGKPGKNRGIAAVAGQVALAVHAAADRRRVHAAPTIIGS